MIKLIFRLDSVNIFFEGQSEDKYGIYFCGELKNLTSFTRNTLLLVYFLFRNVTPKYHASAENEIDCSGRLGVVDDS